MAIIQILKRGRGSRLIIGNAFVVRSCRDFTEFGQNFEKCKIKKLFFLNENLSAKLRKKK